jgi:protein-S-isoprenylcysteine O-methyltransferase Ste14
MPVDAVPARSGVRYPPPLAFAIPWAIGWLLNLVSPMPILGLGEGAWRWLAGGGLVVLGLALAIWAARTFRRAGTPVNPFEPSSALVRQGPFRFSRNPMYVGMTLLYIGGSTLANTFWPILFLPVSLALISFTVIRREEHYLSTRFGAAYDEYRRQVRRWI